MELHNQPRNFEKDGKNRERNFSFLERHQSSTRPSHPELTSQLKEIDDRLRRRYLDRLTQKVKKLRRSLIERNWEDLKSECTQLAQSGSTFGFETLTELAQFAQEAIPSGRVPRAITPHHAKDAIEILIAKIDLILVENQVPRT